MRRTRGEKKTMREVLSMMPEVKPPHNRCCRCGDKIVPKLKVGYYGLRRYGIFIMCSFRTSWRTYNGGIYGFILPLSLSLS